MALSHRPMCSPKLSCRRLVDRFNPSAPMFIRGGWALAPYLYRHRHRALLQNLNHTLYLQMNCKKRRTFTAGGEDYEALFLCGAYSPFCRVQLRYQPGLGWLELAWWQCGLG